LGHARCYVGVDLIRRVLEYRGYQVRHVQNFTDIDDKTIARAQEEGTTAEEIARRYTESYFESMGKLAVQPAHVYPTVTGNMQQIVQYVEGLIEKGFAYIVGGDVYFEVGRFESYGRLSGRFEDSGMVGVRTELEPGKRDPKDFALWKAAKPGEPSWPSPWGEGRPGWHIECSTMVRETLGDQIDIHAGGQDLLFPHHENELAQSECFTDKEPYVKYWAHIGLVTMGTEKMAHSTWNFVTLKEMLEKYEPAAVRLYFLRTHYRSPVMYSEEGIAVAARNLETLRAAYGELSEPIAPGAVTSESASGLLRRFDEQLDDDFNSAGAVGVLFDTAHEVNRGGPQTTVLRSAFRKMVEVLGLPLEAEKERGASDAAPFIELLIDVRTKLRAEGQWALADQVRDGLKQLGIVLKDNQQGTTWEHHD
jgi:cysteinyl-tRNA synthetase